MNLPVPPLTPATPPAPNKIVAFVKALITAEVNSPAVHTAIRNLQAAVIAAALILLRAHGLPV